MEVYDELAVKKELDGVLLDYKYPGEKGPHYVVSIHVDKLDFMSPWPGEKAVQPPPPPPVQTGSEPVRHRWEVLSIGREKFRKVSILSTG